MGIHIRNGRVIDPANGTDEQGDLYIANGRVVGHHKAPIGFHAITEIDATGQIVCPGFIDLQARVREPGQEHKATVASETRAAAAAGITTLCCPPDSHPVIDNPAVAEQIIHRAFRAGHTHVLPIGALTLGLKGEQLSEMLALRRAGCVAMSNARRPVTNTLVLRRALEYAATLGITVVLNAEDPWLGDGCMHEGEISTRLGLPGIPECAEIMAVAQYLILIEQTGVRAHFGQLSTARAAEMIAAAQHRGLSVTADVSTHQLFFTEKDVDGFDSNYHVRPPFRSSRDRDALRHAFSSGVISALCSDHQPHDIDAKLAPFAATEPGISALETLLPLALRLVAEGVTSLADMIGRLSWQPARILGIDRGTLDVGGRADVVIFDPQQQWVLDGHHLLSSGRNTPFLGTTLTGRVTHTIVDGHLVYAVTS